LILLFEITNLIKTIANFIHWENLININYNLDKQKLLMENLTFFEKNLIKIKITTKIFAKMTIFLLKTDIFCLTLKIKPIERN
jgi:hypothetical protein